MTGLFTILFFTFLSALAADTVPDAKTLFKAADVVLEVIPMKARPVTRNTSVDAVEGADEAHFKPAEAMVTFKIRRILKGKWERLKMGGPSRMEQAQEALQKKDYTKILTLNFSDPNREMDKEWVSVAVEDPAKSFGISSWDDPEPIRCKIYLRRLAGRPGSYALIGTVQYGDTILNSSSNFSN